MSDSDDTGYVKNPLGGGTGGFVASGLAPLSGAASGYPGPWYIETQTLFIDYLRVPMGGLGTSATTISLVGATTTHAPINKTQIVAMVTAQARAHVDYAAYTTSAYQQSQQFQINAASADPNGVSYGTLTASSMGPMGSISTARPYYRRVAFTDINQPVYNNYMDGATFPMQEVIGCDVSGGVNVNNYWTEYKYWKDPGCMPGTHRSGFSTPQIWHFPNDYVVWGAFNISKESWYNMVAFIDAVGGRVSASVLFNNPTTVNNTVFGILPLADTGITEYSRNRHEY